jgi:hypothetical protein
VHGGLGVGRPVEHGDGEPLDRLGQRRRFDQLDDVGEMVGVLGFRRRCAMTTKSL